MEHLLILLVFVTAVTIPLLIADGLLNYAAYRGRISYWTFVKIVEFLFLGLLLFLGLCSWFLGSEGWNASEFAMNVVVYPVLIWLFIVALSLGTISLVSGGSPKAFFSMLDEQARIRKANRDVNRGRTVVSGGQSKHADAAFSELLVDAADAGFDASALADARRDSVAMLGVELDGMSLEVARRFVAGDLGFVAGDAVMNSAWSYWTVAHAMGHDYPALLSDVYFAFDEGEGPSADDSDPVLERTLPMLERLLRASESKHESSGAGSA